MTILAKDGSQINTYNTADKETKGQNYKIFSIHKKKDFHQSFTSLANKNNE